MKSLKVFYNGKRLKDVYPHATRIQVIKYRIARYTRMCLNIGVCVFFLMFAVQIGAELSTHTVYAIQEKPVFITNDAPVMERIAQCESSNTQKENGQVLLRGNKNKTVDVGRYQINSTWFKKASELGYNITTEEGNKAMAYWIYENIGTSPWSSSAHCWNK